MSTNDTTPTAPTYRLTREDWLHRAAGLLGELLVQVSGLELPEFHISMGFGGTKYERNVAGVCWHTSVSKDGRNHVFISPELDDTAEVLATVLHELIHVVLDNADGHTGRFAEFATRLGYIGSLTGIEMDISLTAEMMVIAHELGEFPHAKLTVPTRKRVLTPVAPDGTPISSGPKTQKNRWISFACPEHGTPVRMSRTKAALGAPFCGQRDEHGVACLQEMKER